MAGAALGRKGRPWARWSDWRSVRLWESHTRQQLQGRHALRLHGWCIGVVVLLTMWAVSFLQMHFGVSSLAVRYALTLGAGYAVFLLLLRAWAGLLVGESHDLDAGDAADAVDLGVQAADFIGDASGALGEVVGDAAGEVAGDVVGGVLEGAGGDEGALVVIPVLAIFAIVCLVLFGAGSLLLLYFGAEALLAVAVEVAFGYVTASTAMKVAREGWLSAAVRLTWKPLLGALLAAVALGLVLDEWVPQAESLPHAVKLIRAR